jgi:thermopsin
MAERRVLRVAAIAVTLLMVVSSMALLTSLAGAKGPPGGSALVRSPGSSIGKEAPATSPSPNGPHTQQPQAAGAAAQAKLEAAIKSSHVDLQKVYPPNLMYAPKFSHGVLVTPSYPQAPEPAGLADYGVLNTTGTPSAFTIDTTSYTATVGIHSVAPFYLADGVPEGFTSQLNVVVKNVTLHGVSNYTFWAQNVFFYDAFSNQMFIENNIWNFSAPPPAPQPTSTFVTGIPGYTNGSDNPFVGYYAAGTPTLNGVTTPFAVQFFINTTTLALNGTAYTEIDFSYVLTNGLGAIISHAGYDRVLFNNTGGGPSIPQAMIHVDGANITPTGFIPFDAEVMLGGPGGGSTATFNNINATMTLQHWNTTLGRYVDEASAWTSGSETGETAVGVAEYYDSSNVVHLGPGPEFIQPLWNSSPTAVAGAATLTGFVTPSNSWTFVTSGFTYNLSTSAWAPLPTVGNYAWNLTQGSYVAKFMLSDYDPFTSTALALTAGTPTTYNVALTADMSQGVYTPLYAGADGQLPAISQSGTGTLGSPYVLDNNEIGPLASEFATFNDYVFPSYAGISLIGTSAYVEIANPAPFTVDYWGTYLAFTQRDFVPSSDTLSTWLFATSHVSIAGGTVSGWFSSNLNGFPYANVLIWNSTSTLVTGVNFEVSTNAIFTYGGTGNTFAGNTFTNAIVAGSIMGGLIAPYGIVSQLALSENEGGDSIWNNYFATTVTAFETNYNVFDDLYPTVPFAYVNNWNLSAPVPASTVFFVNGISLTGSVTGNATVCGNWWWNFGPTTVVNGTYNNGGFILTGGDQCAAGPQLFVVPFSEVGLPAGTTWSVLVLPPGSLPFGGVQFNTSSSITFSLPEGQYTVSFGILPSYSTSPQSEPFTVESNGAIVTSGGPVVSVQATYTPLTGTLIFAQTGLPATTPWSVTVNGTPWTGSGPTVQNSVAFGSYPYTVGPVVGYTEAPGSGTATVAANGATTVDLAFTAIPPAGGTLAGTVSPSSATVSVDGVAVTVGTSGAFSTSASAGVHSIVASASGYFTYYNNVTVASGRTTTVTVVLNPTSSPPGLDGNLSLMVSTAGASAWVDGHSVTLSSGNYLAAVAPGIHSIEVSATGYYSYYNNVTVASGRTSTVNVALNPTSQTPGPDGNLTLKVTPGNATTWVDGLQVTLSSGNYVAAVTPGVHSIEVLASGYYTYYNNVSISSGKTTPVTVALNPTQPASSSGGTSNTGISTNAWIIIGILAALFIIALIAAAAMGRRRGPGPVTSYTTTDTSETVKETPPP